MAQPGLTHADLAIKLVVDGALRMAQGKDPAQMPVTGMPLDKAQKAKAGAAPGALAVLYPVGEDGVFMQMHGNHFRVWYAGQNCDGVVAALEQAIKRAFPKATFRDEQPHPEVRGFNQRFYDVPFDAKHFASVEATYPIDRTIAQRFVVRVHMLERT
jgi:hypothetical protein